MRTPPPIVRCWLGKFGPNHPTYTGGRFKNGRGYWVYHLPDKRLRCGIRRVGEHQILAMRALGRDLPKGSSVHHVNGDKADNSPGNLVLCPSPAYHALLHQRQRALDATGNADAKRCCLCSGYENQGDIAVYSGVAYHKKCNMERSRRNTDRRRAARAHRPSGV